MRSESGIMAFTKASPAPKFVKSVRSRAYRLIGTYGRMDVLEESEFSGCIKAISPFLITFSCMVHR